MEYLNKIICGDCISVMKEIPENTIDLIVTSPPYNCGISYDVYKDWREPEEYYSWCAEWLKECYRVLKDNRRIAINVLLNKGNDKRGWKREQPVVEFSNLLRSTGFNLNNITLWLDDHRVKFTAWGSWRKSSAPYIFCPYEVIIMANKGNWKREDKGISDITRDEFMEWVAGQWKFSPTRNKNFPVPFPEELPKRCIKMLCYVGDLVMDPFAGSCTTALVAKKLGRNFINIEISPEYCKIGEKRLSSFLDQKPLF